MQLSGQQSCTHCNSTGWLHVFSHWGVFAIQTEVYSSPWQLGLNMTGLDRCCTPSVQMMHFKQAEPLFSINFLSTLTHSQFPTHDEIVIKA